MADQQLLGAEGVIASPLISTDTDEVIGMLKVEKLALFDLNVSTIENFRALSSWIGTAYSNAIAQTGDQSDGEAYLGRTILPYRYYSAQQSFLISLARNMGFDLSAVLVHLVTGDALTPREKGAIPGALGTALRLAGRVTDLCFEYRNAGDEFVVLMPGLGAREGQAVAGGLLEALHAQLRESAPGARFEVTVQALHDSPEERAPDVG
jgi:hypothetical protein